DVTPDRARASVALAGKLSSGDWYVEVMHNEKGTAWVADWLEERVRKYKPIGVALDASGPAGSLVNELQKRRGDVDALTAREMTQGCGMHFDAAYERKIVHRNQPWLNSARGSASQRQLGDAWAWNRKDTSADISPLVAVTIAMQEYARLDGKRKRSGVVW